MCRKCVDPSTPFHSVRDDKILGDSIVFNISVKIGSGRVKTLPYGIKRKAVSQRKRLYGAGDEARTRYLHLGKVALYQMSYTRNGHDVL